MRWASPYLAAHAAYMEDLAESGVAEVTRSEGIRALASGVLSNSDNGVLSDGRQAPTPALARRLIDWFARRGLPACWLCAEGEATPATAAVLEAAGAEPERAGWEMSAPIARVDLERGQPPAGVAVELVASERALDGWLDVAAACGWFQTPAQRPRQRRLHAALALGPAREATAHRYYLARRDGGQPVAMASSFEAGGVVTLTALAVIEPERRIGIGRALTCTRLLAAREHGCTSAVLGPSPDGAKLHAHLGFDTHRLPPDRWFYLPTEPTEPTEPLLPPEPLKPLKPPEPPDRAAHPSATG